MTARGRVAGEGGVMATELEILDKLVEDLAKFGKRLDRVRELEAEVEGLEIMLAAMQEANPARNAYLVEAKASLEENEKLKARLQKVYHLRCPSHSVDASNAWGCPECVRELREALEGAKDMIERHGGDAYFIDKVLKEVE